MKYSQKIIYIDNVKIDIANYDWFHLVQTYRKLVNKKSIVLEIGASVPDRTTEISQFCQHVIGVEYVKKRIPNNSGNITYFLENWQTLTKSIPKNSIDVAISSHVIEHVPNDFKALNELYKVLKPNGHAIINTPNRERLTRCIIELFTGKRTFPFWEHIREYTEADLIKLLSKSKFKRYTITPLVFGIHSDKIKFYSKQVPRCLRKYTNYWEIILYK